MKRAVKNLSLLTMSFLLFSCNEKVAPELQNGSTSTTVPTIVAPTDYFFKVSTASSVLLNFALHRTGPGNASTPCQILSSGSPLTNTRYRGETSLGPDQKVYDISCFMEAEEMSLYHNGLDFTVESSQNTCEYIAYSPFSFHDAITGSSSANYVGVTCATQDGIVNSDAAPYATAANAVYGAGATPVACGFMVDITTPQLLRQPILIPEDDSVLCKFDYAKNGGGNGQNCDLGKLKFDITNVYNAETVPANLKIVASERIAKSDFSCGGKVASCIGGAIKHVPSLQNGKYVSEITPVLVNTSFAKTYKLPKLIEVRDDLYDIVNYRRGLANRHLDYRSYSAANEARWGVGSYTRTYDPALMENYASNLTPSGTPIIDVKNVAPGSTVDFAAYEAEVYKYGHTATPLVAEPFMGLTPATKVNPFYTFHCLDRAMETKARIRMVVRDWDRVYTNPNSDFELITDVFKPALNRAMDLPVDEEEIPGDPGRFNYFDDYYGWDYLLPMTRTNPNLTTTYQAGFTLWSPTAGWFQPDSFPRQEMKED